MIEIELEALLADALNTLKTRLHGLSDQLLAAHAHPAWGWGADTPQQARLDAARILHKLDYEDGQDANRSLIYPALIGVPEAVLDQARSVNEAKARLAQVMRRFERKTIVLVQQDGSTARVNRLRHALANLGHLHLHQIQTTRKIVVCEQAPYHAGFTWITQSARIQRIDRETLLKRLHQRINSDHSQDPGLFEDIALIQSLPEGETLALRRPPHPHPRVNLAFRIDGEIVRQSKPASLPVLYPAQAGDPLPKLRPLELEPPQRARQPRADRRVSEKRFLRTEPVYRYMEHPSRR